MNFMLTRLVLLALLFGPRAFAGTPISFQRLPVGGTIHIAYTIQGCYSGSSYEFVFERGETMTVHASSIGKEWNAARQRLEESSRATVGRLTLSDEQIAGLDRLFAYYRTKTSDRCSIVRHVDATQKSGDSVDATESFIDDRSPSRELKDITTLESILLALRPPKV